jgi:hypothetical protein
MLWNRNQHESVNLEIKKMSLSNKIYVYHPPLRHFYVFAHGVIMRYFLMVSQCTHTPPGADVTGCHSWFLLGVSGVGWEVWRSIFNIGTSLRQICVLGGFIFNIRSSQ